MNMKHLIQTRIRVPQAIPLALAVLAGGALAMPDIADAQRRGGGGGARSGTMARSSISGANHAGQQAAMRSSASAARPSPGARTNTGSTSAANRVNTGNVNANNRVNTGNVNTGNRVNTGDINTGDVNINRDVDVNVDHDGWGGWHDVDVDVDGGYGDWNIDVDVDHYHPVATAAAVATTAAVVGSYYRAVPMGCPIVHTYAVPYYYCGGVYYQQRMQGDTVVYVVVTP